MIWSVSWKNVWRSKIRSSVVIAAFVFGIFGGLFAVAIFVGMVDQRIKLAIGNEASHIQIHNPGYLDNNELKYTIDNYTRLEKTLTNLPEIIAFSPRMKIMGMAQIYASEPKVILMLPLYLLSVMNRLREMLFVSKKKL